MPFQSSIPTSIYAADFETVTYTGNQTVQTKTAVWLAGYIELYTENPFVCGSIETFIDSLFALKHHAIVYFHNLKFDGSFIMDYLLRQRGFRQAYDEENQKFLSFRDMPHKSVSYNISDMGQWYRIVLKYRQYKIEFRDSYKLMPMALRKLGKDFKTKHQKLEMKYGGDHYPNCPVAPNEMEYFKNDLYVLKEALEICYNEGHTKLTIGACCLSEFKSRYEKSYYKQLFPNPYYMELEKERFGAPTVGDYIRKCYAGAWCYAVKGKAGKVLHDGITVDVNSLYPYVMHSMSGNIYPIGKPVPWVGNYIPEPASEGYLHPERWKDGQLHGTYFYVTVKCRFNLKKGALPWIHIRHSKMYVDRECLISSAIRIQDKYYQKVKDRYGNEYTDRVTLHLSCTDYYLLLDTYDVEDFEILHGMYFDAESGMFDDYIDKYKQIKMNSKGAPRTIAKLFSNNLYGKFAASPASDFKVAYINEEKNKISYKIVEANDKEPGYIPIGAAITSYAKNWTVRHAIKNYHGNNRGGFAYADTDSMHLDNYTAEDLVDVHIHDTQYGDWKVESKWSRAIFVRQKTYIEEIIEHDGVPLEDPDWNITCSGMTQRCKEHFIRSLTQIPYTDEEADIIELSDEERAFISVKRTMEDFKPGLRIPGALKANVVEGGTILAGKEFSMR